MERRLRSVVDVVRVPAEGDPGRAIVAVPAARPAETLRCDVLVVGGGTGGVAAALAATRGGATVCLTEATAWLGGQFTSQGVSALDEHELIESAGGTASYYALRRALRDHYRPRAGAAGRDPHFNPGRCWVTRVAFEPRVAQRIVTGMLEPAVAEARLRVLRRTVAVGARAEEGQVSSVTVLDLDARELREIEPRLVIDATELGDLLPLTGIDYRVGAETVAQTGEAHAQPTEPKPRCVQSFTYPFAARRMPAGENHAIAEPSKYAHYRDAQPYRLTIEVHGGEIYGETSGRLAYDLYDTRPGTKGGLWTYRRLLCAADFAEGVPHDVSMFNWPGNDYRDRSLIDRPPEEVVVALQDAKRASLGFLRWLQTEAPASGRRGAPEIALAPEVMGTDDGLAMFPYIRESRRIVARRTIVEQDVSAAFQPGPRAARFDDGVGIGWYPIDIHRAGPEDVGVSCRTRPFQIPLGALLPAAGSNLIAGGKNLGATHITNGCYRLHPVEWSIGEAAGALAAFCVRERVMPSAVAQTYLREFQDTLLAQGVPIAWVADLRVDDPDFAAIQRRVLDGEGADRLWWRSPPRST